MNSPAFYQFLIDVITNLTHLTFIITSLLFIKDDNCLSVMVYSDMSWSGILMCVVAFKGLALKEETNTRLMFIKNVVFLILVYLVVTAHYVTDSFLISLGASMMILYLLNLMANGYEEKFVAGMEGLFGYKIGDEMEEVYNILFRTTPIPATWSHQNT